MSSALAIAATTRVIAAILDDAVTAAGISIGAGSTTSSPPDHIVTGVDTEPTRLNLFLYHVTYNQGWREVGLPTRNGDGAAVGRAPLAIDLHYLLSAYSTGDYEAQMLLGIGMQALHEMAVVTRGEIDRVFNPPLSTIDTALSASQLADQIELVKITPQQLSTEELSKLWAAFPNEFRVSAAYAASVLLIESKAPVAAALPVLSRTLTAFPLTEPVVEAVEPAFVPFAPNAALRIAGRNLAGRDTFVQFDGNPDDLKTAVPVNGGRAASVPLPSLSPGINTFRVIRRLKFGATTKTIVRSNVGSFVLQPVIARLASGDYDITVGTDASVTVNIDPPRKPGQPASILFNEVLPATNQQPLGHVPRAFAFDADPLSGVNPSSAVRAVTPGMPGGTYLVRVRVDGADSPLDRDSSTNRFVGPVVTLPVAV